MTALRRQHGGYEETGLRKKCDRYKTVIKKQGDRYKNIGEMQ